MGKKNILLVHVQMCRQGLQYLFFLSQNRKKGKEADYVL